MQTNSLAQFDKLTSDWFLRTLGRPTAVQEEAWPAIAAGKHTLVSAPTGTGKTLSAFLVFIDRFLSEVRNGSLPDELQLIYVSPLKSLASDIRENLRRPLIGILEEERSNNPTLRSTPFDLRIAVRTGDTSQSERRSMIKKPPHILITTPESLYLLLTSKSGKKLLSTAKAIILDELHAIIDSKRGSHLMLSIARLDKLCQNPLQRIGLSATIEPLSRAAEYLSPEPVTIIAPKMHKEIKLMVTSPRAEAAIIHKDHIWHELARTIYDACSGSRSVIAFVDGRAYAEKLAYFVNQLGGEGFARTHHGSLSKEQRQEVEQSLKNGSLRLLCATSSMELGIDVGDIDQVFQIGCPRSISSTMQRLGRAGHNPDRVSLMHIFPRTATEGLYCGLTAEVVRNGGVEYSRPPRLCLDVLAQHLVSMAAGESYEISEVMDILKRAYPFSDVTVEDVKDVLCMLAGDYEHERNVPVRPRVLYDRIHERVEGDNYSRMLAVSAGGTIPDKGLFTVKNESGVKLGEVDEEFVFEARVGDKFLLGSFSWQISSIQRDAVIVKQSSMYGAQPPFYKAEATGRRLQTGIAFGKIMRSLGEDFEEDTAFEKLSELGLDDAAAKDSLNLLKRQLEATKVLPDDRTIVVEHFRDDTGSSQIMVHSVFGRQVNAPLAILVREEARQLVKTNISCFEDDDGFLLFPYGDFELPEGLLQRIKPETAKPILEAVLPATPLFNMAFRYNAGHALMMGVRKAGRQPLWIQRLRSAQMLDSLMQYKNHPLIRETKRECLEDYWDLAGVEYILNGIRSGTINVCEMYLDKPSPMSLPLRRATEGTLLYEYSPTPMGINIATEEALKQTQMIQPDSAALAVVSERRHLPEDEKQLHSLLMIEGDLIAGELEVPVEWLEALAEEGLAQYIEPGLWIAAEHADKYTSALEQADEEARLQLVLRLLRYRGAQSPELIGERYLWPESTALELLTKLCEQGSAVETDGLYYHADLYNRARKETIMSRRRQIKTLPPERYAALLANRMHMTAPPEDLLEKTLTALCDLPFPAGLWETVLLPARVGSYRPELLDKILSQGNLFWHITPEKGLSFHRYEDINWDADLSEIAATLSENEKILFDALLKRGASFMQMLTGLLGSESPYDTLLNLTGKGLVYADSFFPVRQLLSEEKAKDTPNSSSTRKGISNSLPANHMPLSSSVLTSNVLRTNAGRGRQDTIKQRALVRSKAMTTGRFELARPLKELTAEEQLERAFDRYILLCRETVTIQGLSWVKALETLRVWEYTGRVRRGYFIAGLSGIQFIRDKDFAGTMHELEHPSDEILWLSAADPAQLWGKCLPHLQDRSFLNVPGTAVAQRAGTPVAVLERQGKVLRIFDDSARLEALSALAHDFSRKRLFPTLNRLVVKQYPKEAAEELAKAGFKREYPDYVMYR